MAAPRIRRHVIVRLEPRTEPYRPHGREIKPPQYPEPPDRVAHARLLQEELQRAVTEANERQRESEIMIRGGKPGCRIQFESPPNVELLLKSLEDLRQGIELLSVQEIVQGPEQTTTQLATVFVPDGKVGYFIKKFEQYATEKKKNGDPRHKDLVDRIGAVRLATLQALWTDESEAYPNQNDVIHWEVWLRRSDGRELERFHEYAGATHIEVGARRLAFDDRIVILARATAEQLTRSIDILDDIAELRRAKQSASFVERESLATLAPLIDSLVQRTVLPGIEAPTVCILDTGITRTHVLLQALIAPPDATAIDPTWGGHDDGGGRRNMGHGTEMAGLAVYGDLSQLLLSAEPIHVRHRLESVKILPPTGANDPELYGAITALATARPEVIAPNRPRVFSLAVTSVDKRDRGQPTSWSAAIDALSIGRIFDAARQELRYLDPVETTARRLFVLSAGNVASDRLDADHLTRSDLEPVHDPAQAWNAITVGACTDKAVIRDDNYWDWRAVARPGEISPWSTTSVVFQDAWPIKPDVVYEGGNVATDGRSYSEVPDLLLATTGYQPNVHPIVTTNATSAATAQVARIAAIIRAEYPNLWPEAVRALIVHSARWTPAMLHRLEGAGGKRARADLVRRYGFGVPNANRALRSASDALTLIVQSTIRPFNTGRMREMHLHQLPWPIAALREMGGIEVRLRMTLSYFVEPNPSRRGWKGRYRYASHLLRFDVKSRTESIDQFRKRLNLKALGEGEEKPAADYDGDAWFLGPQTRNTGSIHSDIWTGTAADLAERGVIGVYPVSGWWKDQPKRDRSAVGASYALIATIETEAENVDLWTPVANQVEMPVEELAIEW